MGCGIQDKTPIDGDYCFTRKICRKLRDASAEHGITAYDLYHQLHQEYNKAGPNRNGKGRGPVYARPGKQLEQSILLRRIESSRTASSNIQPRPRGASHNQRTVEITNNIGHRGTCKRQVAVDEAFTNRNAAQGMKSSSTSNKSPSGVLESVKKQQVDPFQASPARGPSSIKPKKSIALSKQRPRKLHTSQPQAEVVILWTCVGILRHTHTMLPIC